MGPFCSREASYSHPLTHERAHTCSLMQIIARTAYECLRFASAVCLRTFLVQYPGGMSLKCVHQLQIFDYSVINHGCLAD